MSAKISAGLVMYRVNNGLLEVLLAHPGGPLYEGKDIGYWGIPKGEVEPGETIMEAALREFAEETGLSVAAQSYSPLGSIADGNGKIVYAWAFPGSCDTAQPVNSNLFAMEWPKNSAVVCLFPEIDRLEFFTVAGAVERIEKPQTDFIRRLARLLEADSRTA